MALQRVDGVAVRADRPRVLAGLEKRVAGVLVRLDVRILGILICCHRVLCRRRRKLRLDLGLVRELVGRRRLRRLGVRLRRLGVRLVRRRRVRRGRRGLKNRIADSGVFFLTKPSANARSTAPAAGTCCAPCTARTRRRPARAPLRPAEPTFTWPSFFIARRAGSVESVLCRSCVRAHSVGAKRRRCGVVSSRSLGFGLRARATFHGCGTPLPAVLGCSSACVCDTPCAEK